MASIAESPTSTSVVISTTLGVQSGQPLLLVATQHLQGRRQHAALGVGAEVGSEYAVTDRGSSGPSAAPPATRAN